MQTESSAVIQFSLPFGGMQDRIRAAAERGDVLMLKRARVAMNRDDISDILILRALRLCQLIGGPLRGDAKGEWRCAVSFSVKGFRPGGILAILLIEGRVFVEDFQWDLKL